MNKRLMQKKKKMRNLKRHSDILSKISERFKISSTAYLDGYFIFNMGPCSVCHFSLEETPDWKYGIWLKDNAFNIFGENIELIDKFKPSAAYFTFDSIEDFVGKVSDIQENPKYHLVNSLRSGALDIPFRKIYDEESEAENEEDRYYYEGYQAVNKYNDETGEYEYTYQDTNIKLEDVIEEYFNEFKSRRSRRLEEIEHDRKITFNFLKYKLFEVSSKIDMICVTDSDACGWRCSPRYNIDVVVRNGTSKADMELIFDECYNAIKENNNSDERKTCEHEMSLDYVVDTIKKKNNYHYKFSR